MRTDIWTLRRCSSCGALESDAAVHLVVDPDSDDVLHIRGLLRCGRMVAVDNEVTS
jgi:hypothetical protein